MIPPPPVDLATLLGEMTALKSEVRTETRAARELREQLTAAHGTLTVQLDEARGRLARGEAELRATRERARHVEALRLIALRDRAEALARVGEAPVARRGFLGWWRRRPDPVLAALREGLALYLHRFDEALAGLGVARIATIGRALDLARMETVETAEAAGLPPWSVVGELQSGWLVDDRVLRAAKVIVNAPTHGAGPGAAPEHKDGV